MKTVFYRHKNYKAHKILDWDDFNLQYASYKSFNDRYLMINTRNYIISLTKYKKRDKITVWQRLKSYLKMM